MIHHSLHEGNPGTGDKLPTAMDRNFETEVQDPSLSRSLNQES